MNPTENLIEPKAYINEFDILDSSLVVFRVLGKKIKIVTSPCGYGRGISDYWLWRMQFSCC
jgi:hypothetical protein